jgi:hypothetical protein
MRIDGRKRMLGAGGGWHRPRTRDAEDGGNTEKEPIMHPFQLAILAMALTDTDWTRNDDHRRRRQLTAAELDALADWGWRSPGLRGIKAACAKAVHGFWRPRTSHRLDPMPLPAADAPAQG